MIKISWCSGGWPELCARFGPETACVEEVVSSIPGKCNNLFVILMCSSVCYYYFYAFSPHCCYYNDSTGDMGAYFPKKYFNYLCKKSTD